MCLFDIYNIEKKKRLDIEKENVIYDFVGTTFDLVRVAIRLERLSIDGTDDTDFFFSSIIILVFVLDFVGAGFNVNTEQHVEELDLNSIVI